MEELKFTLDDIFTDISSAASLINDDDKCQIQKGVSTDIL